MASELRDLELGTRVRLAGWITFKRLHKRVAFIGLRDWSGTVLNPAASLPFTMEGRELNGEARRR